MAVLLVIVLFIVFIALLGNAADEAVYKQIDKHSDTPQQAKNRKAIYNSIGHLIVRSIFKK